MNVEELVASFNQVTRNLSSEQNARVETGLSSNDRKSPKMRLARALFLRIKRKSGFPESKMMMCADWYSHGLTFVPDK